MKPQLSLTGETTGWIISDYEMKTLLRITRQAKASALKFDALAIFREAGVLNVLKN